MKDRTIVKLTSLVCITVLASVYFVFVKQDGAIFGTVGAVIGAIIGEELGRIQS